MSNVECQVSSVKCRESRVECRMSSVVKPATMGDEDEKSEEAKRRVKAGRNARQEDATTNATNATHATIFEVQMR